MESLIAHRGPEKNATACRLSQLTLCAWAWSRSNEKGINVIVVPMNGSPERAQSESREFVHHANLLTGTSRENTSSKRDKALLKQFGGERGIRTLGSLLRLTDPLRSTVLRTVAFNRSAISPTKAASRAIASQTFALYSQCQQIKTVRLHRRIGLRGRNSARAKPQHFRLPLPFE
jgi:hypothetical protein